MIKISQNAQGNILGGFIISHNQGIRHFDPEDQRIHYLEDMSFDKDRREGNHTPFLLILDKHDTVEIPF